MSDLTPRPVPLDQTRQRVIDQLIEHYAVENLDDRGLEDRLGKAVQATTVADLQALLADLPTAAVQAPLTAVGTGVARADYVPERQIVAAVMGGVDVQVRYPGEKGSDARRRERLERKEARDHHRLGRGY